MENLNKKNQLESLSKVIQTNHSLTPLFICIDLSKNWKEIVGEPWYEICLPVAFNNALLTLRTPHSCYIQDMQFQKENLIKIINAKLGKDFVNNIRFVL